MIPSKQYKDLAKRLNEIHKIDAKKFEQINESLKLFELNNLKLVEPMIKEFERIVSLSKNLPAIEDLVNSPALIAAREANLSISRMAFPPMMESLSREIGKSSELWKSQYESIQLTRDSLAASFIGIQSQVARMAEISLLAEKSLSTLDFSSIGNMALIKKQFQESLKDAHFAFAESYSNLFNSLEHSHFSILSISPVVTSLPPIEFYYGNKFIESIYSPEIDVSEEDQSLSSELQKEIKDDIESYLARLDESLIKLWHGATQAIKSDNPDAIRHYSISLRELLTQVIHRLAPDDNIKKWSDMPEMYFDGKPTRKARLLYVCRGIDHEPFAKFLRKDIESTLACINLFQEGTHSIDSELTPIQLDLLKIRTESTIRFLIKTHFETNIH